MKVILKGEGPGHPFRGNQYAGVAGKLSHGDKTKADTVLERMSAGKFTILDEDFARGVCESYKAKIRGDGSAIVKPGIGNILDVEQDTYNISKELGFEGLVPKSTRVTKDGKNYSVQQWVEDTKVLYKADWSRQVIGKVNLSDAEKMAWMDVLTGNVDRHTGNIIISDKPDSTGTYRLFAIDHHLAYRAYGYNSGVDIFSHTMNNALDTNRTVLIGTYKFNRDYYSAARNWLYAGNSSTYKELVAKYGIDWVSNAKSRLNATYKFINDNNQWAD